MIRRTEALDHDEAIQRIMEAVEMPDRVAGDLVIGRFGTMPDPR